MISLKRVLPENNVITNNGFYYLNLGKYNDKCSQTYGIDSTTGYQRPIMIVVVLNGKNATSEQIEKEVRKSLSQLPNELKTDCYSIFELTT